MLNKISTHRTIASHFVRAASRGAERRGEDVEALLQRVGIPVSILTEPLARVSSDQFASFVHLLWRQLDDELLGFGHQPVRFGSFFLVGRSVIQSATLNSALHRAAHAYALIQGGRPPFAVDRVDDTVRVIFDDSQLDDPDHFAAEMLIVAWHRFSSWLIKRRISLLEVSFNYPAPKHRKEYDLMFSAPSRFDAGQTAFSFDASYLSAPVLQNSGSLRLFIQNYSELLWRREYGDLLSSRIRRIFTQSKEGSTLPFENVAAQLGMTRQTLRRHLLLQEGVGFQTIKDQWRRDVSISLLTESTLSIAEIARQTGFSETSAFHHAFKKWTGLTASAYRS